MSAEPTPSIGSLDLSPGLSLAEKGARAAGAFARRFGRPPTWMAAAPGRVNVIGEHVDYCDGLVLPMAIDRHVIVAAGPSPERAMRVFSVLANEEAVIRLDSRIGRGGPEWSNYVRGVLHGFMERGITLPGLNVIVDSDLPMGGGLSSSAALEVGIATLLEMASGHSLAPAEKALVCQRAEQDFAGVPCGIMDQFASVHGREGHLLLIDCRTREVIPVPLRDQSVTLLVINTNIRHELGNSQYPVRRAQCEEAARLLECSTLRDATLARLQEQAGQWPDPIQRRGRHVVSEIARTREAADAFMAGDWKGAGELMFASHASLRDDFEVSCPELDLIVQAAEGLRNEGVYGCRMTGGGFGGCCVALVEADAVAPIGRALAERYLAETGLHASLFVSYPAEGAARLTVPSGR